MKHIMLSCMLLLGAALALDGCLPFQHDRDERYPAGHHDRDADHHDAGPGDHHDAGPGDHHDNGQTDHHDGGQTDHQHDPHAQGKDDTGTRAIMAYTAAHALPIHIRNIERLPAAPETPARYRVTADTTNGPRRQIVRIVDYTPANGELTLER